MLGHGARSKLRGLGVGASSWNGRIPRVFAVYGSAVLSETRSPSFENSLRAFRRAQADAAGGTQRCTCDLVGGVVGGGGGSGERGTRHPGHQGVFLRRGGSSFLMEAS